MAEWTHEQLLEVCDAANRLTPDQMCRQIAWLAVMRERSRDDGVVTSESVDG